MDGPAGLVSAVRPAFLTAFTCLFQLSDQVFSRCSPVCFGCYANSSYSISLFQLSSQVFWQYSSVCFSCQAKSSDSIRLFVSVVRPSLLTVFACLFQLSCQLLLQYSPLCFRPGQFFSQYSPICFSCHGNSFYSIHLFVSADRPSLLAVFACLFQLLCQLFLQYSPVCFSACSFQLSSHLFWRYSRVCFSCQANSSYCIHLFVSAVRSSLLRLFALLDPTAPPPSSLISPLIYSQWPTPVTTATLIQKLTCRSSSSSSSSTTTTSIIDCRRVQHSLSPLTSPRRSGSLMLTLRPRVTWSRPLV